MSRRWLRPSSPSASSDPSPDSRAAAALRASLVADLSRRLFGKRLLLAIPVVAAAALSEQIEDAQAAPPPTPLPWTLTGNNVTSDGSNFLGTQNNAPLGRSAARPHETLHSVQRNNGEDIRAPLTRALMCSCVMHCVRNQSRQAVEICSQPADDCCVFWRHSLIPYKPCRTL